jgi:glycerophosphoryl diester phosphodiesterase
MTINTIWRTGVTSDKPTSVAVGGHRGTGCTDNGFAMERNAADGVTLHPENTLESFRAALAAGADFIETDLIRTKDNHLVLTHSNDLKQHVAETFWSTLPKGKQFIDELTLKEVQALKVGPDGRGRIPSLKELLELIKTDRPDLLRENRPDKDFALNLEIKDVQGTDRPRSNHPSIGEPSVGELALREIEQARFPLKRIRFSSFSQYALVELAAREPAARIGMLFDAPVSRGGDVGLNIFRHPDYSEKYLGFTPDALESVITRFPRLEAVHPEVQTVTDEMVKLVGKHKLQMSTWGWLEQSPLKQHSDFADATSRVISSCKAHNVPLTIITDRVEDMRRFVAQRDQKRGGEHSTASPGCP